MKNKKNATCQVTLRTLIADRLNSKKQRLQEMDSEWAQIGDLEATPKNSARAAVLLSLFRVLKEEIAFLRKLKSKAIRPALKSKTQSGSL